MGVTSREEPGPGADVLAQLQALAGCSTDVGIQSPDGGPAGEHQPDGLALAQLMAIHEFGAGVPMRPVLRPAADDARDTLASRTGEAVTAALDAGPEAASAILGPVLLEAMRQRMRGGVDPPLAPDEPGEVPDDRGPGDTPLVDSGQLLAALHWSHRGPA